MRITNIVTNNYSLKVRIYGKGNRDTMNPAILFLSGWNPSSIGITSSDILAPLCAKKLNCICIVANLRGMGSKGDINSLTRADFLSDVIAIYDFIADYDGIDKTQISVAGESFGGYMACLLSSKRLIENLLLRVPTDFSNEVFQIFHRLKLP